MWRSKHQAAGQRQDSKRGTEIWVGSKHQKVKNRIYIALFHEDTSRTICKHTETENHRITGKQSPPPLKHNPSASEPANDAVRAPLPVAAANTLFSSLQVWTLRRFICNTAVKSLLLLLGKDITRHHPKCLQSSFSTASFSLKILVRFVIYYSIWKEH